MRNTRHINEAPKSHLPLGYLQILNFHLQGTRCQADSHRPKSTEGRGFNKETVGTSRATKRLYSKGKRKPGEKCPPPSGNYKKVALAMQGVGAPLRNVNTIQINTDRADETNEVNQSNKMQAMNSVV